MENRTNLKTWLIISMVLAVVLPCVFCSAAFGQPWDGNGVEGNPYLIYTAGDMQAIGADANYWDAHFELMADIDLSSYTGTQFNIIGNGSKKFTGVFNGNGYTIGNFTYSSPSGYDYVGLFGYVWGSGAAIKNLGLVNPDVQGEGSYVGSLVGVFLGKTISNCFVLNCNVQGGSGQGSEGFGGLVGRNAGTQGTIAKCYSTGNVTGDAGTGGLVGINAGKITDSYSAASVYGYFQSGGLTAYNSGTVTNCHSTGSVSGGYYNSYVGGLVYRNYGKCIDCFWDKQTSGVSTSAGGTGKTTVEMKQQATFTNWDFTNIWDIIEHTTYPFLREADVTVTVQGTVYDAAAGGFLPDVTIVAEGKHTQTDQQGEYEITGLTPGQITLAASKKGYENKTQTLNAPEPGQIYYLDFYLTPKVGIEILGPEENDGFTNGKIIPVEVQLWGSANVLSVQFEGKIDPDEVPPALTFDGFSDDGKSGDRVAGDNVYTAEVGLPGLADGTHILQVLADVTVDSGTDTFVHSVPFVITGVPEGVPTVTLAIEPQEDVLIYKDDRVIITAEATYEDSGVSSDRVYALVYNAAGEEVNNIVLPLVDDVYTTEYYFTQPGPHTVDVIADPPEGSSYLKGSATLAVYVHIDMLNASLRIEPESPSGIYPSHDYMHFVATVSTERGMSLPDEFSVAGTLTLPNGTSEYIHFYYVYSSSVHETKYYSYIPRMEGSYSVVAHASAPNYARRLGAGLSFEVTEGSPAKLSDELKRVYQDGWLANGLFWRLSHEARKLADDGDFLNRRAAELEIEVQWEITAGLVGAAHKSWLQLKGWGIENALAKWVVDWLNATDVGLADAFVKWIKLDPATNTLKKLYDEYEKPYIGSVSDDVTNAMQDLDLNLYLMDPNVEDDYIKDLHARKEFGDFLHVKAICNDGITHHFRQQLDQEENIAVDFVVNGTMTLLGVVNPPAGIVVGLLKTAAEVAVKYDQLQKAEQGSMLAWGAMTDLHNNVEIIGENFLRFAAQVKEYEQHPVPEFSAGLTDDASPNIPGVQEYMEGSKRYANFHIRKSWARIEIINSGPTAAFAVNALFEDAVGIMRIVSRMKDSATGRELGASVIIPQGAAQTIDLYFVDLTCEKPFYLYPGHIMSPAYTYEPGSWNVYCDSNQHVTYYVIADTGTGIYCRRVIWEDKYDPVSKEAESAKSYAEGTAASAEEKVFPTISLAGQAVEPNVYQIGPYPMWNVFSRLPRPAQHSFRDRIGVSNPSGLSRAVVVIQPVNGYMTVESVSEPGVLQNSEIIWNIELHPHETKFLTFDFVVDDPNIPLHSFATIPPAYMTIYDAVSDTEQIFETGNTQVTFDPAENVSIKKCKPAAGGGPGRDGFACSGRLYATPAQIVGADQITINIWGSDDYLVYSETINVKPIKLKKGKYTYTHRLGKKKKTGYITNLQLDTKEHRFSLKAKKIDLTGLSCPLFVGIGVGDYVGLGEATERIVNGKKKLIPIRFMRGYANTMRAGKRRVKPRSLEIHGGIAVADWPNPADLKTQDVTITWGTQEFTIPAGSFYTRKKWNNKYKCEQAPILEGGIATATVDFKKCSFKLLMKKTNIDSQSGLVDLAIAFDTFDQTVELNL